MTKVRALHLVAGVLIVVAIALYLFAIVPEASPLLGIIGAIVEIVALFAAYFAQPKSARRTPGDDSPKIF